MVDRSIQGSDSWDYVLFSHTGGDLAIAADGSSIVNAPLDDPYIALFENNGSAIGSLTGTFIGSDDDSGSGLGSLIFIPNLATGAYILAVGHCCASETDVRTNSSSYVHAPYLDYRVSFSQEVTVAPPAVPVPAALPLFASALVGGSIVVWRRRRRLKS
jgi:hypothetical protein